MAQAALVLTLTMVLIPGASGSHASCFFSCQETCCSRPWCRACRSTSCQLCPALKAPQVQVVFAWLRCFRNCKQVLKGKGCSCCVGI